MTHFEHALWSVKHCVCVTLFSVSKRKQWSVLFLSCVWNCFLPLVNKKSYINYRIIASRPKRKFITLREQDVLLKAFYNKLDEVEKSFLGNWFIDEHDIDDYYELDSGRDNKEAENEADVTEVEKKIEQIEE